MTELDDEFLAPEAKETAIHLKSSISNLVRIFYGNKELFMKLRQFGDHRNQEMIGYIEIYDDLKKLWGTKLTTPLEEQTSMNQNIHKLRDRINNLNE
jgi:hypothetical protein